MSVTPNETAVTGPGGVRKEALVGMGSGPHQSPGLSAPSGGACGATHEAAGPVSFEAQGVCDRALEFTAVAKAGDMQPGQLVAFDVEGTQVAIANVDGIFYAFGDNCTQAQCSLAEGDLEGTSVFCPCHGSVFDVTTGAVLAPGNRGELPGPGGG